MLHQTPPAHISKQSVTARAHGMAWSADLNGHTCKHAQEPSSSIRSTDTTALHPLLVLGPTLYNEASSPAADCNMCPIPFVSIPAACTRKLRPAPAEALFESPAVSPASGSVRYRLLLGQVQHHRSRSRHAQATKLANHSPHLYWPARDVLLACGPVRVIMSKPFRSLVRTAYGAEPVAHKLHNKTRRLVQRKDGAHCTSSIPRA